MTASAQTPVNATSTDRILPLVVGGCLAVGLLDTAQWYAGNALRDAPTSMSAALRSQFPPWVVAALLAPLVLAAARRWPLDRGRWRRHLGLHLLGMVLFCVIHVTLSTIVSFLVAPPPPSATFTFMLVKFALFRSPLDAIIYLAVVGTAHAVRSAREAREREQAAARLEASLTAARLQALRDRLHPHFLFNTLNAVTTLALRQDHEGVIRTVAAMSDLLRSTLDEHRRQEIPLEEELAFLERYLEIQQLRFGDRLTVTRSVDADVLPALVPAMLLQPLVENAMQHAVAVKPGPVQVDVRVARQGDVLVLEVADSGPGFSADGAAPSRGMGLANSRARIAALYGDRGVLECGRDTGGGALVRVRVPWHLTPTVVAGDAA